MRKIFAILLAGTLLLGLSGCYRSNIVLQNFDPSTMPPEQTDEVTDHTHQVATQAQTVADPITGYCGNIQTTLHIGNKAYTFMYGYSVTLTDILINLNYDPMRICRCIPEYTVDTEFDKGYGINLTEGYARCEKGQADLTQEQIDQITEIIRWAETTNCEYPINN